MPKDDRIVFGGVDTHRDTHVAAVVDATGRVLASAPFSVDTVGYEQLGYWLGSHGRVAQVGVEGTGSYGAGLARYLTSIGVEVAEVNRANRQLRRRFGKTDTADAQAAARAVLSGQATGTPKTGDGPVEAIRMLSVARRSAVKARTQAINQLHALVVTAPDQVKHQLGELSPKARVKVCAAFRPGTAQTTITYAKKTLRLLARRYQTLTAETQQLDTEIKQLCAQANPALLAAPGIGPDSAATLLVTAGDNPHRIRPKKTDGRQNPKRDHPLPETVHRPRGLPPPHQPTPDPLRSPSPLPTPKQPNNPRPGRHRPPQPPHTPLTTRTRPLPQPPPRHPIPNLAHPKPDLTKIGASPQPSITPNKSAAS